jgi:hypothetical protein
VVRRMEKKRYGSFWDILGWKTIEALCFC